MSLVSRLPQYLKGCQVAYQKTLNHKLDNRNVHRCGSRCLVHRAHGDTSQKLVVSMYIDNRPKAIHKSQLSHASRRDNEGPTCRRYNCHQCYCDDMLASKTSSFQPSAPLKYTITSSSPHSGQYAPENIIEDKPMDQASRWSGAFQANTSQWITLELESLSVLSKYLYLSVTLLLTRSQESITFGKVSKFY